MYVRARSVDEALETLSRDGYVILSGGTDFYPARAGLPLPGRILDISGIEGLKGILSNSDGVTIGALTTWSEIAGAHLPPAFDALKQAAKQVGSIQIQNTGTIAGNLCNASPAADGVPPLLCLDAVVDIMGLGGVRHVAVGDFIQGNRKTALQPGEFVTTVRVPAESVKGVSHFTKLGARKYLVISIVMAAVRIAANGDGHIERARVAVGSCSAAAIRLNALEQRLIGQPFNSASFEIAPSDLAPLSPIDDGRATAAYRQQAASELVERTLTGCWEAFDA